METTTAIQYSMFHGAAAATIHYFMVESDDDGNKLFHGDKGWWRRRQRRQFIISLSRQRQQQLRRPITNDGDPFFRSNKREKASAIPAVCVFFCHFLRTTATNQQSNYGTPVFCKWQKCFTLLYIYIFTCGADCCKQRWWYQHSHEMLDKIDCQLPENKCSILVWSNSIFAIFHVL